ncbi:MAG: hypothetical protein LUP99_03440 [Methanomicrobiales archaeon]|nr:hypothetical protein [Methanomicrobiales archaeon]
MIDYTWDLYKNGQKMRNLPVPIREALEYLADDTYELRARNRPSVLVRRLPDGQFVLQEQIQEGTEIHTVIRHIVISSMDAADCEEDW